MSKYYALMFVVVAIALYYAFIKDPCNQQLRDDFSNRHPTYEILSSEAAEGSPESVRCHISYRMADSEQVHDDIWLYLYTKRGWEFSRILESDVHDGEDGQEQTTGVLDEGLRKADDDVSAMGMQAGLSIVAS